MMGKRGRPSSASKIEGGLPRLVRAAVRPAILGPHWLQSAEEVAREIRSDYNASVAAEHAYDMASLGDELLEGVEHVVLDRDALRLQSQRKQQQKTAQTRKLRVIAILSRNQDLIEKHKRLPLKFTRNSIAKQIRDEWKSRGDSGKTPAQKTIDTWIKNSL